MDYEGEKNYKTSKFYVNIGIIFLNFAKKNRKIFIGNVRIKQFLDEFKY